jgi:RNA polymerase sigma factor (sigma-70 family)
MSLCPRNLQIARRWLRRYARFLGRGGPLPDGDLEAIADLGLVMALRYYRPSGAAALSTYARRWVLGEVRRAVGAEHRHREAARAALGPTAEPPLAERRLRVRQLLAGLTTEEAEVLWGHAVQGEPLAAVGTKLGRSRVWAHRVYARALRRARAAG